MKKKKSVSIFVFILILTLVISIRPSFNFICGNFLKITFKSFLNSKIHFKKIDFNKGKIYLTQAHIVKKYGKGVGKVSVYSDEICLDLSLKNPRLISVFLKNAQIFFNKEKQISFFQKKSFLKKKSFFKFKIDLNKADIALKKNDNFYQNIRVEKEKFGSYRFRYFLSDENSYFITIFKRRCFLFGFNNIQSKNFLDSISYFSDDFENILSSTSGLINGDVKISKNEKMKVNCNLSIEKGNFYSKKYFQKIIFDKMLVNFKEFNNELNFYNSDFIFRFLTKNNFWLKTEVFNASVLATYKNSTYNLKNIDGSFYFDSKTGSKTTINGFLENEKLDFNIDSKMVFNSNLSNWLTLNINFLEKNKIVSKISVNGDQKQKSGKYILNFSKISKYHYKLLKPLIFKNFANFELEKGKLDCAFNISTNETNINEIKCENFLAQNICIGFLDKKCFLKNATGTFSAFYTNFQKWDFQKINSKISISDLLIETSVFPKILAKNAKIDVLNGQIQEASISLESKGVFTKIDFSGFLDNIETKGVASGNIKNLFELANKEFDGKFENYDFSSEFRLINRSDELKLTGKLNVLETLENFTFSIDFSKFFNKQLLKNIHSGWIRAENVDLEKYSIFFPQIKPVKGCATFALFYNDKSIFLRLKGKDFSFNPNYMKINIPFVGDGDSFSFEEGKEIICNYDLKKQKLFVSYDGFLSLALPNLHLSFDVNSFQLSKKKNEKFDFKLPNVVSENLKLDGNVSFGIFEKDLNLDILVNKAKGDISCLSVMLKNLFPDYCRGGVKGYIKGEKDVFYLSMPLKKGSIDNIKWGLNCDFSKLDVSLSNNAKLKDVSTHFEWCSKCSVFFVEQFLGDFYLGENKKYHLSCPYIVKDENELAQFDLRVEKDNLDLIRLNGKTDIKNNCLNFSLNYDNSHFFGEKFDAFEFSYDKQLKDINSLKIKKTSSFDSFFKTFSFFTELNFPKYSKYLKKIQISKSSGISQIDIFKEKNRYFFKFFAKDLIVNNKKIDSIDIVAMKTKNQILFEKFLVDDFLTKFSIFLEKDALTIPSFDINYAGVDFSLSSVYQKEEGKLLTKINKVSLNTDNIKNNSFLDLSQFRGVFQGEGDFSLELPLNEKPFSYDFDLTFLPTAISYHNVKIESRSPFNLHVSSNQGFNVSNLNVLFTEKYKNVSFQTENIKYDFKKKKWYFCHSKILSSFSDIFQGLKNEQNLPFYFVLSFIKNSFNLDGIIDLSCNIEAKKDFSSFKIFSPKTSLNINTKKQTLNNIIFSFEKEKSLLEFTISHMGRKYSLINEWTNEENVEGKLTLLDLEEKEINPLAVYWNFENHSNMSINEIRGHFAGLDVSFCKKEEKDNILNLLGSINIDFSKSYRLLPITTHEFLKKLNLRKGYKIIGNVFLDSETLSFKRFLGSLFGKNFEVNDYYFKTLLADIDMNEKNLHISNFKISDSSGIISIKDFSLNNLNDMKISNFLIKDFRPSLLTNINGEKKEIKPLVIREISLDKIIGNLNDLNSIKADGKFLFINSFRRDRSVFDIPADMLGRIFGIDLEILTPINGELLFNIENKKINLLELKDSFSEGKRSKFFLLEKNPAYIDFNGNINIHIKMKHFVLFKFTEPFVISITGNVEKPKVNLNRKRGFLAS